MRLFLILVPVLAALALIIGIMSFQSFQEVRPVRMTESVVVPLPEISRTQAWVIPSDRPGNGGVQYVLHTPRPLSEVPDQARCGAYSTHIKHQSSIMFDCAWMEDGVLQRMPGEFMLPAKAVDADVNEWRFEQADLALVPHTYKAWVAVNLHALERGTLWLLVTLFLLSFAGMFLLELKDEEGEI